MPPRLREALFERLPLAVVALMLAIGGGLELVRFGALDWAPKLPLALLVVFALVRSPSRSGRAPDADDATATGS